ncbi:carbon storage regulator [Microbulbifer sp. TRSA005]|uniref:carbon storage regulator n=1 Tax=Microbulbifer sp. TRSA005 TaxID=3243383 RepID=UPI004039A40D
MLILKRQIDENLRIRTSVSVVALEMKGNQIQIGIHALKFLPVHRKEIYVRFEKERKVGSKGR